MTSPGAVAFSVFGIDIMWYGILVTIGIVLTVAIICKRAPKHKISSDRMLNLAIIIVISGIIGARLYYVLFNWKVFADDPLQVFNFRAGGLAIHGGLLLGAAAAVILCKIYKEKPLNILDLCFAVIPLGQAIGRWGNFFNSEAHGGPTDLPWGIIVDGVKVHPTFLYESIWCFLLFIFLIWIDNRRQFVGQTFLLYCILYSLERFFVEGLRTDSLMLFGEFRVAQVVSIFVFFIALVVYISKARKASRRKK